MDASCQGNKAIVFFRMRPLGNLILRLLFINRRPWGTEPYGGKGGQRSVLLEMPPTGILILPFFTSKSSVNGAAVTQHKAVHGTQNVFSNAGHRYLRKSSAMGR